MAPRLTDLFRRLSGSGDSAPSPSHDLIASEATHTVQQLPEVADEVIVAAGPSVPAASPAPGAPDGDHDNEVATAELTLAHEGFEPTASPQDPGAASELRAPQADEKVIRIYDISDLPNKDPEDTAADDRDQVGGPDALATASGGEQHAAIDAYLKLPDIRDESLDAPAQGQASSGYLQVELKDALVSSYDAAGAGEGPADVKPRFPMFNPDGTPAAPPADALPMGLTDDDSETPSTLVGLGEGSGRVGLGGISLEEGVHLPEVPEADLEEPEL